MSQLRRTFKMPSRCDIRSVTIRETNGIDEQQAALAADSKPGSTHYIELMKLSIEAIDGKAVLPGSAPVERYNTRTRKALSRFFEHLNDVGDDELDPLVAEAEQIAVVETLAAEQTTKNGGSKPGSPAVRSGVIDTSDGATSESGAT